MSDTNSALIALVGVLAGGYLNNFLGEDFKRFRDGQALAGALAGELASHATGVPMLQTMLHSIVDTLKDEAARIKLYEYLPPASPVFDASVSKLGLLGPALAHEVAFVYEHIRAFRTLFRDMTIHYEDMSHASMSGLCVHSLTLIDTVNSRGAKLIADLNSFAKDGYWRTRPWLSSLRKLG
ncbi:hypothetical protein [Robbsia andropogonis]|uniref:hypothetical protein n=1 Tax=Robbsia andropogonis TaxID=28092 RepID=UPI002A6B79B0|nr:hypothetical protein [Robbsia andropogonis]